MRSLADGLPPDIARQIHPDWRKNEAEYWAARETILDEHRGKWIAFANGSVVAAGTIAVDVYQAAHESGQHPFVTCVGREFEPCRTRRATFAYDTSYPGAALPVIGVEFRTSAGLPGIVLDRVIPDPGADATTLPWADCQLLQLDPSLAFPGLMSGVTGGTAMTMTYQIWARLDSVDYPCRLQVDFQGSERLLGRDVLNRLEVLFRGPAGEVVINP